MSCDKISWSNSHFLLETHGWVFTLSLLGLLSHTAPGLGFCSLSLLFATSPFPTLHKKLWPQHGCWSLRTKKKKCIGFGILIAQAPGPALLPNLALMWGHYTSWREVWFVLPEQKSNNHTYLTYLPKLWWWTHNMMYVKIRYKFECSPVFTSDLPAVISHCFPGKCQ